MPELKNKKEKEIVYIATCNRDFKQKGSYIYNIRNGFEIPPLKDTNLFDILIRKGYIREAKENEKIVRHKGLKYAENN